VVHVPTELQYVDIMTKGLPTISFGKFKSSLQVITSTTQTAGGGGLKYLLVYRDC
jgi:hypothetical protein